MAELESYSLEDLKALRERVASDEPPEQASDMALADLMQLRDQIKNQNRPEPGLLSKAGSAIGEGIVAVGNAVDSVTGAPVRAGVGALQDGTPDTGFWSAYGKQFGEDPALAPTGKEIAAKAGLSTEETLSPFGPFGMRVSPAGAAGLAIDIGADPTNIIPVGAALRGVGKGAVKSAELLGKGAVAAGDLATGTKAFSKGAEIASSLAEDSKRALSALFKPKQADDFAEMAAIAQKNGIDPSALPSSVEFGPGSFISRGDRAYAEGVSGQNALESFADSHRQVQDAFNNKIVQVAGGAPVDPAQAGTVLREGFDAGAREFFDTIDLSHNKIIDAHPNLMVAPNELEKINSAVNGIEKFAKGRLRRGIAGKAEAQQLLDTVAAIRNSRGSYKQTYEALSDIGHLAFTSTNKLNAPPVDVQKLRDLYFQLDDALIGTVRGLDKATADSLVFQNKAMSDFFKKKALIARQIGDTRIAPEQVFRSLIVNGTTDQLKAIKEILPPEYFNQLKGAFLENLVKRDPDGAFNFSTLYSALRNKQAQASILFDPKEISEVGEVIKLGDRFGPAVLSSSGTGASNSFLDIPKNLGKGATNRAIIDSMKSSARGRAAEASRVVRGVEPEISAASQFGQPVQIPGTSISVPTRGRTGLALKGAQFTSIQPQNEEETAIQRRLKARGK